MKILIGSLLFATAIFINFPELNSSPQPSSGVGPSRRNFNRKNLQQELGVSKRLIINLFGQDIEVDVEMIGGRYEAVGCRVINPRLNIPTRTTRKSINFMTQADFKRVGRNFVRIVIYVHEDDQKRRSLLGAKLPPTPTLHEVHRLDDPQFLNPDHTKWFITYDGVNYVVEVDFVSQNSVDIKLYGRRNIRPSDQEIMDNWHEYPYIHFGGVYFLVFRNPQDKVLGAALDPFWKYRPGEEFEHLNPHHHTQINNPVEQSLQPQQNLNQQQNLDQQHHFDQQQNFNQYQNMYQNPYPYGLQVADPNQIPHYPVLDSSQHYLPQGGFQTFDGQHYPQQGGFPTVDSQIYPQQGGAYPPPNFDPSRDRPQHGGYQTPRFHFNRNGNFPSHPPPGP